MPLTRLYRLGATPQRLVKAYVLDGEPRAVAAVLGRLAGRMVSPQVTVHAPAEGARALRLDSGWRWLATPAERERLQQSLVEAVLTVAAAARRGSCLLLPSVVRPLGSTSWDEWVASDGHFVAMLDDVEREIAHNLFRSWIPVLVALTGRAGIETATEPLGSRRLAISGRHLACRYLASASQRHLSLVESELRRTTGIRDLRAMDVHPLGPAPDAGIPSLAVRCVDAQAFCGSAMAQALLLQALAMVARRMVREGRRQGNTDARALERGRAAAILHGMNARIPVERRQFGGQVRAKALRNSSRDRSGKARSFDEVAASVLVLELVDLLAREFGTLDAGWGELAPILAWTASPAALPRTETEMLVRDLGRGGAAHERAATLVAEPAAHAPDRVLGLLGAGPDELLRLDAAWQARLSEPPAPGRGRHNERSADHRRQRQGRPDAARSGGPPRTNRSPRSSSGLQPDPQRRALIEELAGTSAEGQAPVALLLRLAGTVTHPAAELLPWLGKEEQDLVLEARRRARPPAPQRVTCSPHQLRSDSRGVARAMEVARGSGAALLTCTVDLADRDATVAAVGTLVRESRPDLLVRLLCTAPVREEGHDIRRTRLEVLIVAQESR